MGSGPSIVLCRSKCCPRLAFTDDGKTGAVTADREHDDVYVDPTTVSIRFNLEQLQVLADELAKHGIVPSSPNQYSLPPRDDVGSSNCIVPLPVSDLTNKDTEESET